MQISGHVFNATDAFNLIGGVFCIAMLVGLVFGSIWIVASFVATINDK